MKDRHQVGKDFDDILITSGAQQVMDLLTKSLCNEGDVVICEAPSFIGSLNTFRSFNARLRGVPMESDGMDIELLEQALKEEPRAKFIYTIPNFQNPSGITMSLEKRHAVYDLAKKYKVLILEDNPYGDLRFHGDYIPCIKSFDEDGIVVYEMCIRDRIPGVCMNLIFDSHAHYDDRAFDPDRAELLQRLPQLGVCCVINVGADLSGCAASLELAQRYPCLLYTSRCV